MSQKIKETEKLIYDAYGKPESYIDELGGRMADICREAAEGQEPAGFIAKKVQETFDRDDLEMIATMFIIKIINERNMEEEEDEECDCPGCRMARGEDVKDDEMIKALKEMVSEKFPGMEAMVVKVPRTGNGKTDC